MGDVFPQYSAPDDDMQEEDNEDFYGNGVTNGEDTQPGALDPQYHVGPHRRCLYRGSTDWPVRRIRVIIS